MPTPPVRETEFSLVATAEGRTLPEHFRDPPPRADLEGEKELYRSMAWRRATLSRFQGRLLPKKKESKKGVHSSSTAKKRARPFS